MTFRYGRILLSALAALLAVGPTHADTISGARVAVQVRGQSPEIVTDLSWTASQPRDAVRFYLASAVDVAAVESDGRPLTAHSSPVAGTDLLAWDVDLPVTLQQAASRKLTLQCRIEDSGDGIRVAARSGRLLPDAGWFPRLAPEADALVPHAVVFSLPEGVRGIAAGLNRGGDSWQSRTAARPYAVWGELAPVTVESSAGGGPTIAFEVWRRPGARGAPAVDFVAGLITAVQIGVGPAPGDGPWKLVDTGVAVPLGGARTVFWNEAEHSPAPRGDADVLRGRDLAGAVATACWTEAVPFRGDLAAFLGRAVALQIGDYAYSAWADPADRVALEKRIVRPRAEAFVKLLPRDRALRGLCPIGADGAALVATRGTLAAHYLARAAGSERSLWMHRLHEFRSDHAAGADWDDFAATFSEPQLDVIRPVLETTDLPDFHVVSHGPVETEHAGSRYEIVVGNRGAIPAWAEIVAYDASGAMLYEFRAPVEPGGTRSVMFGTPRRIAAFEIEPRGGALERDLSGQYVKLASEGVVPATEGPPAYPLQVAATGPRVAKGITVKLPGARIEAFDGWLVPYGTHQGASGACLIGTGTVVLEPEGKLAASWNEAMGRGHLSFPGSHEIWIRFALEDWPAIEAQLGGAPAPDDRQRVMGGQTWIQSTSFKSEYYDGNLAQVPPPGAAVVVFKGGGEEWRGFAVMPQPDGTVTGRFWDHLTKDVLWEARG